MKAIKNARIYDYETYIENGYILFDETIVEVGSMDDYLNNNYEEIDCDNHLVLPGLIVGHTHIYSTFARGMNVRFNPKDFLELLEQLWWKMDRSIDNDTTYYSGIVAAKEYLENGITSIIDHHASGEIKGSLEALYQSVVQKANMKGLFCFETSDRFNIEEAIEENNQFIQKDYENAKGLFGMHASLSLSDQTLQQIYLKQYNHPIHIHVAESDLDVIDSLEKHQKRVINRLDSFHLIEEDSLFAHGIYLNHDELEIIKERHSYIVVNPSSNMNNGVGFPNISKMKKMGIPVLIGNDGLSSGITQEYLQVYYGMHHFTNDPLGFSLDTLKSMIKDTQDYFSKMIQKRVGKIEKGYTADLLVLPYIPPTPIDENNVFAHMFFGLFHSFKPKHVFSNGVQMVTNYQIENNLLQEYKKANQYAKALWEKINKEES